MAKRKNNQSVKEAPVSVKEEQKTPVKPVETKPEPASEAEPKAPKRRIRIRKKATKKLSAAIICMDPSIQRFI
jgi:hypothetical protein